MYKLNFIPTKPGEQSFELIGTGVDTIMAVARLCHPSPASLGTIKEAARANGVQVLWGDTYEEAEAKRFEELTPEPDEHEGEQTLWEASGLEEG